LEVIHDFSGSFEVAKKAVDGTVYLDHTPVNVNRNDHNILYSGVFANTDEIDMDWDVPNADSGSETWTRVPYTGITEQAVITAENALALTVGTWLSGTTGAELSVIGAVQENEGGAAEKLGLLDMPFIFEKGFRQVNFTVFNGETLMGALLDISETINGTCGGSARFEGTADDQTGDFSGTFRFNNYCEENIIVNGQGEITGIIDLFSEELVFYHYAFTGMTVSFGNQSFTLDGRVRVSYLSSPPFMVLSYVYTDNTVSYWLKDLIIDIVEGLDYVDITDVMGRYYDPAYGYTEIELEEPIRIYNDGFWPASGKFLLVGAVGNQGGSTSASLEFLSETSFLVEADTDGDGAYDDYSSGIQLWSEQ